MVRDAELVWRSALQVIQLVGREGFHGMGIYNYWHNYDLLLRGRWAILWPLWPLHIATIQRSTNNSACKAYQERGF